MSTWTASTWAASTWAASTWAAAALLTLLSAACGADTPSAKVWSAAQLKRIGAMSPIAPPPASPGNKWADDAAAARLGHRLFFETAFSPGGKTACATCHQPAHFFSDGLTVSEGEGQPWRHTPNLIAAANSPWQGWDGACDSLWCMALLALEHPNRMGSTPLLVAQTVAKNHAAEWAKVFGPLADVTTAEAPAIEQIFVQAGKAMGAYMRQIRPAEAPIDRYVSALKAGDAQGGGHLSESAVAGLDLYIGRAGCIACHFGPRFTNDGFYNVASLDGVAQQGHDRGRADGVLAALDSSWSCLGEHSDAESAQCVHLLYVNPKEFHAIGAFKVASLRNAYETAPFMHGGLCKDLNESIEHYNRIDLFAPPFGITEPFLESLNLSDSEKTDLHNFLRALSGPLPQTWWAKAPAEGTP